MYGFPTHTRAQNQQRKWTATLTVDASRCATTIGQFEIRFVRLKEFGPDLGFTEKFRWIPGSVEASLNFWWDEAVGGLLDWRSETLRTRRLNAGKSQRSFSRNRGRGNYGSHKLVRLRPRSLPHLHLRSA
jgi:hypothetical protein